MDNSKIDAQEKLRVLRENISEQLHLYEKLPTIKEIVTGYGLKSRIHARKKMRSLLEEAVEERLFLRDSMAKLIELLFVHEPRLERRVKEVCLPLRELWRTTFANL